ncbi:MAG: beta-glucosidase [Frankiales bacterium]|nr:beta-glucosidase [Frankiales bacterium]
MADIAALLSGMTVSEKVSLCLGSDFWHTAAVPSAGVERILVSDGPHGLRRQPDDVDHLGMAASLPATCFPTASALSSSWDVELVREVGTALGVEARTQALDVVLGPGINIKRSPLCGRNFEYLSEDPHLAGLLGAAMVQGLQSQQVGASVKHFAANNQETDRLRVSAEVDERTLREIYLPAFEYVVKNAQPWTVMCAYNRVNGTYASQHHWLLTEVLRDEWGFDGLVMSDWGAVHDRVAALAAGLDLEMPPQFGVSDVALVDAVASGALDESLLDLAAGRVLQLVERTRARTPAAADFDAHHALARRVAGESIVLLKNSDGVLPLTDSTSLKVCVVGEFARAPRFQGAGSSQVNPTRVDVPLDELRILLPLATVDFAAGFDGSSNAALAEAAAAAAADADVVLLFLGLPPGEESEGFDRLHMDLPREQTDLLARLSEGDAPIVVLLSNGSAVRTDWSGNAAAIVECWLSGQATGGAVADILTGAVNPSGRLAESIPLRLQDNTSYLNFPGEDGKVRYGEGVFVGYRGYDKLSTPVAFPFGHGLSYTGFDYRDLRVNRTGSYDGGDLAITVDLTVANVGAVAGQEVVQVYVGDPAASVARPPRELRAFAKVALEPGEERQVSFTLTARDLSYWSSLHRQWVVEGGEFTIEVGASSRDIRLTETITVEATPPALRLDGMSTLQEWLADPVGGDRLRKLVGDDENGRPQGILGEEELIRMIGNFPISSLASFGLGITQDMVRELTSG